MGRDRFAHLARVHHLQRRSRRHQLLLHPTRLRHRVIPLIFFPLLRMSIVVATFSLTINSDTMESFFLFLSLSIPRLAPSPDFFLMSC
jgi:hypothetical protein